MDRKGLSPRVRGSRAMANFSSLCHRSIPASAGQPIRRRDRPEDYQVYPRECGAAHACCFPCRQCTGLSPRVRGSPITRYYSITWLGSIPASAGQPWDGRNVPDVVRVYPRECGAA